jgi:hypothetical protein
MLCGRLRESAKAKPSLLEDAKYTSNTWNLNVFTLCYLFYAHDYPLVLFVFSVKRGTVATHRHSTSKNRMCLGSKSEARLF